MSNIKSLVVQTKFSNVHVLVTAVEKKFTSEGALYLDFTFQDMSAAINGKMWNAKEEDFETFGAGEIVSIGGDVTSFRKEKQLRVTNIKKYEGVDIAHFLPSAPIEADVLKEKLYQYILQIENSKISRIVSKMIEENEESFLIFPAATKNHHEYVNGLVHHVISMLDLAEFICSKYEGVNKDLLYAGVILHDFGKVMELSGVVATEYTLAGKLLGHITIAVDYIGQTASKLGIEGEEVLLLQHMVLAHHGKLEYGSPKQPIIMEAEILHYLDNLDARINMVNKAVRDLEIGDHTSRIMSLEGRKFYNHGLDIEEE